MSNLSISPSASLPSLLSELSAEASPAAASLSDFAADALQDAVPPPLASDASSGSRNAASNGLGALNLDSAHPQALPSTLPSLAVGEAHPEVASLTDMAQVMPRHDIVAERHGSVAFDNSPAAALSSSQTLDNVRHGGAMPGMSASRPDAAGVNPVAREVQVTWGPASLLHLQPTEFRATLSPSSTAEEARHPGFSEDGENANADGEEQDGDDSATAPVLTHGRASAGRPQDEIAVATAIFAASATAPTGASDAAHAIPGLTGNITLYQQIVSALHALGVTDGPVFHVLEELRRQRRVVLATPSGLSPGLRCPAHVDVLWPMPGGGRALRLSGELLWAQSRFECDWLMTHVVKAQGQGNVRQLSPVPAEQDARQIAVCLGAQAAPMVAWSQACLRVRDGTRLWRALEPQWSLRLAISTVPLSLQAGHSTSAHGAHHHAA